MFYLVFKDLSWSLDSFPQAEVDNGEDEEEAEHELPANVSHIPKPGRFMNCQDIPPVLRRIYKGAVWKYSLLCSQWPEPQSRCIKYSHNFTGIYIALWKRFWNVRKK